MKKTYKTKKWGIVLQIFIWQTEIWRSIFEVFSRKQIHNINCVFSNRKSIWKKCIKEKINGISKRLWLQTSFHVSNKISMQNFLKMTFNFFKNERILYRKKNERVICLEPFKYQKNTVPRFVCSLNLRQYCKIGIRGLLLM